MGFVCERSNRECDGCGACQQEDDNIMKECRFCYEEFEPADLTRGACKACGQQIKDKFGAMLKAHFGKDEQEYVDYITDGFAPSCFIKEGDCG